MPSSMPSLSSAGDSPHRLPRWLHWVALLLLCAAALTLATPAGAADAPAAPTAAPAAAPTDPAKVAHSVPAPFLWEVHSGGTTHYLLGSVHLLPQAAHPLPAGL